MATISAELTKHKGIGPGFDFLRIALAAAIFYGHAKWIAGSSNGVQLLINDALNNGASLSDAVAQYSQWAPAHMFKRAYHAALVPMFFALSGFLVSASAFRLKQVKAFLLFRVLRILPALATEVTLSALILGPIFTSLTLAAYFSEPSFYRYFGNIFGFVTLTLPGVFAESPAGAVVNSNLWTLPAEFYCYLITAIAMATSLFFDRKIYTILFALATAGLLFASYMYKLGVTYGDIYPTPVVVYYFFVGVLFFHWKDHIELKWTFFAAACALGGVALGIREGAFIAPIFVTYATIYIGMCRIPPIPLLSRGDYSYGVYLYGFPIAQAVIISLPVFKGHENWLALVAGALTLAFAALSWHFIEKPTLSLKKRLAKKKIPIEPVERAHKAEEAEAIQTAAGPAL